MSNIVKHALASHAWVSLERLEACAKLTVRDDGVGFDVERTMAENGLSQVRGFGLTGMRERIDILGGRLEVSSRPGHGTTVTAWVPTEGSGGEIS
jgi:two-component system NarL family sensor kinase